MFMDDDRTPTLMSYPQRQWYTPEIFRAVLEAP